MKINAIHPPFNEPALLEAREATLDLWVQLESKVIIGQLVWRIRLRVLFRFAATLLYDRIRLAFNLSNRQEVRLGLDPLYIII